MRDQRLWTWHVVAGVAILVLGGLHMAIMHLDDSLGIFSPAGEHPIEWGSVKERAKSAGFMVTYVLLLGTALYHGLYGLRNIVFEMGPGPGLKRAVGALLALAGLVLFVFGAWAAWASFRMADGL